MKSLVLSLICENGRETKNLFWEDVEFKYIIVFIYYLIYSINIIYNKKNNSIYYYKTFNIKIFKSKQTYKYNYYKIIKIDVFSYKINH